MAVIVDIFSGFVEFTGHTPDYLDNPRYLVFTSDNLSEYETFKAQGFDKKYWRVTNGVLDVMTQPERDAADVSELSAYKQAALPRMADTFNAWFQSKYTLENQQTIGYLLDESERLNLPNRFAYFKQLGDWVQHFLDYYYQVAGQILFFCLSIADVDAVHPDFTAFMLQWPDPDVVIRTGRLIMD